MASMWIQNWAISSWENHTWLARKMENSHHGEAASRGRENIKEVEGRGYDLKVKTTSKHS